MAEAPVVPMITVSAPEGYKPEEGKPISFQVPATSIDMKQIVPKEIGEKGYFKKITNFDELFKSFDGAQAELGKPKYGVPAADAPQEIWDEYLKGSRPAKEDDYSFEADPNAPAELKAPEGFIKAVKKMFYDAGIPIKQATMIQKGYDALMMSLYKENKVKNDALDKQFVDMTKSIVGEDPKVWNEGMARSKQVLEYLLPKELHGFIQKADNNSLAIMAALTQVIEKKYMKEDELPRGGGQGGGSTVAELRKEAMDKQSQAMKLDGMDPKKKILMDEATELYNRIAKM